MNGAQCKATFGILCSGFVNQASINIMSCHLQGLSVLVTRPAHQADALCELIEQAHGRPVRFPVMEIDAAKEPDAARASLQQAARADLMIFVSRNAAEYAFPLLPEALPLNMDIAAVGKATAQALTRLGLEPTLVPQSQFNSEGLLALEALHQMQNKRVILVRGNSGRVLLEQELQRRGAEVIIAEVYQRRLPKRNPANLIAGWSSMVDAVTVTSNELLDNLFTLLGSEGQPLICQTPLIVISERMADHASQLGCRKIVTAASASDQGILQALCTLA